MRNVNWGRLAFWTAAATLMVAVLLFAAKLVGG